MQVCIEITMQQNTLYILNGIEVTGTKLFLERISLYLPSMTAERNILVEQMLYDICGLLGFGNNQLSISKSYVALVLS